MSWTTNTPNSRIFQAFVTDMCGNTAAFDLSGTPDTFKNALMNNTGTPDATVAAASTAYNTGQWTAASQEVAQASHWPVGGQPLVSPAISNPSAGVIMFDATDTASIDAATTLAAVFGCLIYDDTLTTPVADQGVCYLYFGGTQSVTNGTFTVVYAANGLFRITV